MTFEDLLARAEAELDWQSLEKIAASFPANQETFTTYLDAKAWLHKFWQEAVRLELNLSGPKRILDLGTGAGYFLYVCRCLGHEGLGLERPGTRRDEFHSWMKLSVIPHEIAAKQPLPTFPMRFDLVTAFRVPFNVKRDTGQDGRRQLWSLDDWAFFLNDLRDNVLVPGGTFFMKMNTQSAHVGPRYGDAELMHYFNSRGAVAGQTTHYVSLAPLL